MKHLKDWLSRKGLVLYWGLILGFLIGLEVGSYLGKQIGYWTGRVEEYKIQKQVLLKYEAWRNEIEGRDQLREAEANGAK